MPLESKEDFALGNRDSEFCKYCVDKKGQLLSFPTILKNNVHYYRESQGLTAPAATKLARELLKAQPAWQKAKPVKKPAVKKTKKIESATNVKKSVVKKTFCKVCPTWEIKNPDRCSNTIKKSKQIFYFCTKKCKERFEKAPEKFA